MCLKTLKKFYKINIRRLNRYLKQKLTFIKVPCSAFQTQTLPLESPLIILKLLKWKKAYMNKMNLVIFLIMNVYDDIARHHTSVSLFLSILPREMRWRICPLFTSQTLILSMLPVTIISSSLCQAIERILAKEKHIY